VAVEWSTVSVFSLFAKFNVNKIGKQIAVNEIMHNFREDN
jgi:hypothetical protein